MGVHEFVKFCCDQFHSVHALLISTVSGIRDYFDATVVSYLQIDLPFPTGFEAR